MRPRSRVGSAFQADLPDINAATRRRDASTLLWTPACVSGQDGDALIERIKVRYMLHGRGGKACSPPVPFCGAVHPPKFASTRACVVSRWRDAWFRARLAVQVAIHARSSAAAAHDSASEASHRLAAEAHTELALAIVLASGGDAAAAVDAVDAVLSGRGLSPPPLPGGVGDAVADQRSTSRGRAAKKEPVHEGDLAQAATAAAVVPEYVSTALIANAKAAADVVAAARAVPPPVASDVARGEVPDRGTRLPVWSDDEVRVSAVSSAGAAVPHAAFVFVAGG